MNAIMKWTDQFRLQCRHLVISLVHTLFGFQKPDRRQASYRRIVIIRTFALGDALLGLPAIHQLKSAMPDARLSLCLTTSSVKAVAKMVANYSAVSPTHPLAGILPPSLLERVFTINNLLNRETIAQAKSEFSSIQPDAVVILPQQGGGDFRFWLIRFLFLRQVGYRRPVHGWRTKSMIQTALGKVRPDATIHASAFPRFAVCDLLGQTNSGDWDAASLERPLAHPPAFPEFTDEVRLQVEQWIRTRLPVAVSIGALQEHKQWPLGQFGQLVDRLVRDYGASIVVLGTKEYTRAGDDLARQHPGLVHNLCGKTTVAQLAYVLKQAHFCVGNDGGAVHLSAAVGTPTIALIPGLEKIGSIDPLGCERYSIRNPVPCAPCYSLLHCPQGHGLCMKGISLDQVLEKIADVLTHCPVAPRPSR